jgi:FkbM family methyltransferase
LEDERSKEALLSSIIFKLTCDRDILMPFLTGLHDEYFSYGEGPGGSTFHLSQDETFIDVGANVGQSIRRFLSACNWQFNKIHSFEPDKSNFVALQTMTQMLRHPGIHTHKLALSDHTGTASFVETFAMDSRISEAGNQQVRIEKLDNLIDKATFIKMDVEGHEAKVLRGAEQLIKRCRPRMAVTTYHYPDDLLDVFKTVENMDLGYQFRFHHHLPYYYDDVLYISQPGGW